MVAVQEQLWTGTAEPILCGALAEGIYVTHDNAIGTATATLWQVGNPPTALDTATFSTVVTHGVPVSNDSGLVGWSYIAASSVRHLVIATYSGSTLTLTDHALSSAYGDLFFACYDGSGFLWSDFTTVRAVDTAGALSWSASTTDLPIGYPSANRFLSSVSGTIHLRNSSGTSLSTIADPSGFTWVGTGTDLTTYIYFDLGALLIRHRTLSNSGDTLSWVAAEATFDPGWPSTLYSYPLDVGRASCWGGQIVLLWGGFFP